MIEKQPINLLPDENIWNKTQYVMKNSSNNEIGRATFNQVGEDLTLNGIFVEPKDREIGIGKALVKEALDDFRKQFPNAKIVKPKSLLEGGEHLWDSIERTKLNKKD